MHVQLIDWQSLALFASHSSSLPPPPFRMQSLLAIGLSQQQYNKLGTSVL